MAIITVAESVTNKLSHVLEQLALPDLEVLQTQYTPLFQNNTDTMATLSWRISIAPNKRESVILSLEQ